MPDGSDQHFDEQIQMYWWAAWLIIEQEYTANTVSPNNLLTHPLVSPVNLGSLGGLCPLLIVSSSMLGLNPVLTG